MYRGSWTRTSRGRDVVPIDRTTYTSHPDIVCTKCGYRGEGHTRDKSDPVFHYCLTCYDKYVYVPSRDRNYWNSQGAQGMRD